MTQREAVQGRGEQKAVGGSKLGWVPAFQNFVWKSGTGFCACPVSSYIKFKVQIMMLIIIISSGVW